MNKATLINKQTGNRVAVEVGSQTAQQYFGQGYTLEGAGQAPTTGQATFYNPEGQRVAAGQGSPEAQNLLAQGYKPEVNVSQLTTDQMATTPTVAPVEPATTDDYMAGIQTSNEGLKAQIEALNKPLESQAKKDAIDARMEATTEEFKGSQRELQEDKWKQTKLYENLEQVQALMPQIAKVQAEYDKFSVGQEGRVASASSIYGRQALIQRQKSVELAGLSAVAQAYQGNVDLARNITQDALNAQWQDQTMYLDNLRTQLDSVKDNLNREDKAKADSLNLVIAERERAIETEKKNKERVYDIALDLASQGIPSSEVQKILGAKDLAEAIALAGDQYKSLISNQLSISDQLKIRDAGLLYDENTGLLYSQYERDPITGAETDPSKVFGGFNFTSYATDPNWGNTIGTILEGIPEINSITDLDAYIKSKNSTIANANKNNTSQNAIAIWQSSKQSGVPIELLTAIAQHESYFGTSNVAKNNNNPGGITWNKNFPESMKGTARPANEGGHYVKFATLKDGFDAVAGNINRRFQGTIGNGQDSAFVGLQASSIVTKISPRLANNKELINEVAELLKKGVSKDDIEDNLRHLSQSEVFEPWRNVTNTAFSSVKMTNQQRQDNLDIVDDYIASGDNTGAVEHIKSTILGNVGATEKKMVTGRDDALTSVYEIERLLNDYASLGGNTGLLTGKVEDFNKNVLKRTGDENLAYIANEIAMAIQKYRQDLTGAAFTESEAKEYNRLFPSIGKSPTLNTALINSLKSQYERNQRKFWERQLGTANYNKLEQLGGVPIVGVGDMSRFSSQNTQENKILDNYFNKIGY
jgi:hypothetical protein